MPRLLFEKMGNAVWMSHLDLMRVFQRSFKRAGLTLTHTHGFNPRPSVSIALPLSVGVESVCELLDFDLEGQSLSGQEIMNRLNPCLVKGVQVREVYIQGRKLRELALLHCQLTLTYDSGVPTGAGEAIAALFSQDALVLPKKTKSGVQEQNIIPMLRRLQVSQEDRNTLQITALLCCQEPSLNPMQLAAAIVLRLPELKPDACQCRRIEIYDREEKVFR